LAEATIKGVFGIRVWPFAAAIVGTVGTIPTTRFACRGTVKSLQQIVLAPVEGVTVATAEFQDISTIAAAQAGALRTAGTWCTFSTTAPASVVAALAVEAVGDALDLGRHFHRGRISGGLGHRNVLVAERIGPDQGDVLDTIQTVVQRLAPGGT